MCSQIGETKEDNEIDSLENKQGYPVANAYAAASEYSGESGYAAVSSYPADTNNAADSAAAFLRSLVAPLVTSGVMHIIGTDEFRVPNIVLLEESGSV